MFHKLISAAVFVFLFQNGFAQSAKDSINNPPHIVRLHVIPLGISVESRMAGNKTLVIDAGTRLSYIFGDENNRRYNEFSLFPYLMIEPRFYTNLNERRDKGKRTDYFSGAYGAVRFQFSKNLYDDLSFIQLSPMVGFQRVLGRRGYWDVAVGAGTTLIKEEIRFGLTGDFKLGFILN